MEQNIYQKINTIISNIPIYWINLDKSKDRKKKLSNLLKLYNLVNKRISAIEGETINLDELKKTYSFSDKLTNFEIACSLSHIKAISTALKDNLDNVIIMEDDCSFEYLKYKYMTLNDLMNLKNNWDIIKLSITASLDKNQKIREICNDKLLFRLNTWGATAYIINKTGMKKIIDEFNKNKILDVSEKILFFQTKTYSTVPYFTYYYNKDCQSTIRDSKHTSFADENKQFWDNYHNNLNLHKVIEY